jgi:hypothetical protein
VGAVAHSARWLFTAVFGGALAVVFGLVIFATAVFCIVGALVQGAWRSRC